MKTVPNKYHPATKATTPAALASQIINFLDMKGHAVQVANSAEPAVYGKKLKQQYKKLISSITDVTPVTCHISTVIARRNVKIEIVFGTAVQSDAQKKFQQKFELNGGIYIVAKCFEDFYKIYNGLAIK